MMIMTAKVNLKKVAIALGAVVAVILAIILIFGGSDTTTATTPVSGNDGRVAYLEGMGWQVSTSPVESSQVRIPQEQSPVYQRYNELQKSQGYDLTQYAGKTVMRYVYKVNNFPNATEPVYATILVYKDQIIGGDVTDTSAKGIVQGLKKQTVQEVTPTTPTTDPTTPE